MNNPQGQTFNQIYGLTKLEYACIKLGIPETGDKKLDEIILKSERKRLAGLAMEGCISMQAHPGSGGHGDVGVLVKSSIRCADELLKQLEITKTI